MAGPTRLDHSDNQPRPTRLDHAEQQVNPTRLDHISGTSGSTPAGTQVPWTPLPSELHSAFTIHSQIGNGGEGLVYQCVDETGLIEQGSEFAVKVYTRTPEFAIPFGTPEFAEQFPLPHAVHIFRRQQDPDGRHYEIMEYCPHGTLEAFLNALPARRALDGNQAHEILVELVTALNAIQRPDSASRMLHGDIKPENILVRSLSNPFDLVLTDFGLSVRTQRSRITNAGRGTLAYSAPGALQRTSLQADWWSLGMVMYRVLVGRDYFTYPDGRPVPDQEISYALSTRPISLEALDSLDWLGVGDLHARWSLLLTGLLTRDPDHRWGYGQVVSWLNGETPAVDAGALNALHLAGADRRRRATSPFAFSGSGELYDTASVANAAARDLDGFARKLSGQGATTFMRWVQTEFGEAEWPFSKFQNAWSPQFRALYFVAQLNPSKPLVVNGFQLNGRADLIRLAQTAGQRDDACALLGELHGSGLVDALDSPDHRPGFVVVDADWEGLCTRSLELIRSTGQYQALIAAGRHAFGDHSMESQTLARLVYAPALAATAGGETQVRAALEQRIAANPDAGQVNWFRTLLAG